MTKKTDSQLTPFGSAVLEGLSQAQKSLPPKFLYDERGSQLFDRICACPEYYVTRTEQAILQERAGEISRHLGEHPIIFELGSGSSRKTRILLDAMEVAAYVPIDISREMLSESARRLRQSYPRLPVLPICADFSELGSIPDRELSGLPGRRMLFFPGSTIGNFEPGQAGAFLKQCARFLSPQGSLLIGVDLVKMKAILEPAYDDAEGITAEFNLNLLHRMRRELDAELDLGAFRHLAHYDERLRRVEMHLVSVRPQTIEVLGHRFAFERGETIHTESSYKYTPARFEALANGAGLIKKALWTDPQELFSVFLFELLAA